MRLRTLAAAVGLVALVAPPGPHARADGRCRDILSSATVEAAVARPKAQQGADLPLPAVYSAVEYQSRPASTYAVAGPYTLGVFEGTPFDPDTVPGAAVGLIPLPVPVAPPAVDTPVEPVAQPAPYGRAEAAFPVESIPDDTEATWGPGRSQARVGPTGGEARAAGAIAGGAAVPAIEAAGSWSVTRFSCETLTVVAGWTASNLTYPGGRIDAVTQRLTLAVSPEGSTAEVVTDAGRPSGLDDQPLAPFTDPFNANSGQTVEVGEPRVETGRGYARVAGGVVRISFGDPERSDQRIELRLGSLQAEVRFEGAFAPVGRLGGPAPTPVSGERRTGARQVVRAEAGAPPVVSADAVAAGGPRARLAGRSQDYRAATGADAGVVLLSLLAVAALIGAGGLGASLNRARWPTAAFALDRVGDLARRFRDTYLRW